MNPYRVDMLDVAYHSPMMRTLNHASYVFEKKLSHTADSQDQRHRMVPASRPMMTLADTVAPDYVTPRLIRQNAEALAVYQQAMTDAWAAKNRLLALGVPLEYALYVLPNAKALRLVESGSFIALQHKWTLRTCFNAQEEIYLASMDEIAAGPRDSPAPRPAPGAAVRAAQPDRVAALHRGHALLRRARVAVVPQRRATPLTVVLPWGAHLYTALGAVLAFAATQAVFANDFRTAFLALIAATVVDATDGVLARALRVKEHLPHYDGARLDDIVDYLTFVFVPAVIIWRAGLLPGPMALLGVGGDPGVERLRVRPGRRQGPARRTTSSPGSRRTGTSRRCTCSCGEPAAGGERRHRAGAGRPRVRADPLRLSLAHVRAAAPDARAGRGLGRAARWSSPGASRPPTAPGCGCRSFSWCTTSRCPLFLHFDSRTLNFEL